MSSKNWSFINNLVSIIAGIAGLFGIYTSLKASEYEEQQADLRIEKKYGLTPVGTVLGGIELETTDEE